MRVCIRIKPETKVRERAGMTIKQFLTKNRAKVEPEGNPITIWATLPVHFSLSDLCGMDCVEDVIVSCTETEGIRP